MKKNTLIEVQNMHLLLRYESPALSSAALKEAQLDAARQLTVIFSHSQIPDGLSLSEGSERES